MSVRRSVGNALGFQYVPGIMNRGDTNLTLRFASRREWQ